MPLYLSGIRHSFRSGFDAPMRHFRIFRIRRRIFILLGTVFASPPEFFKIY
ncbi:hypothetical protein M702_01780 [Neisseria gonorrhoeae SK28355]|uniref:Uncharacterized protein n=1 Tax=Neisseria gonorrhoeae 3502 TaxID=1193404 RepID=A0AA44ZHR1_NEIGO|nr:hypothetical protein M680_06805 [Neisseria gonorrhoeae SK8976]KLR89264.1 hypothetical protein M702_01780 [Neisseria gonorrhoeae SK28355]KLR95365.1 hypothetical protein M678_05740 [Neisseria gonorrhoeae SK7461]KLR99469.1 hypothetical protein M674_06700 [Neisseria gonorrhoeae SK708]KLS00240.1 hypothetical protein M683_06365 [Neisseria gonorrhoeae SK14515]KLS02318.1 hypothetical protein M686_02535 [Neisseria gonorrhoeae SK16942]KLS12762.1 hypothetical protein M726_02850 [Neisseria gonorrhoeae